MEEEGTDELGARLLEVLAEVPGPRRRRGVRLPLPAILTLAVCDMLGGARSLCAMAQVELAGKMVNGDALYAQRKLNRYLVEQGGDYLWVIKENQPTVKEALSLLFAQPPWGEVIPEAMHEAGHRGRRERRWLRASSALNHYLEWPYAGVALCRTGLLHGTHLYP